MKILLTGSTGFVGRNLLLDLLRDPAVEEVIAAVRNPLKLRAQLKHEGFAEIPANLTILAAEAPEWQWDGIDPTHVVHCAGLIAAPSRDEYFRINVDGTLRLLNHLPATLPLVILSSQAAVGPTPADRSARLESDAATPVTWYGESKWEMETRLRSEFGDRSFVILRPPMVLGPRDTATLPLFRLAKSSLRVKPGTAAKSFSWVGVTDLCAAIRRALAGPFNRQTYFVTSSGVISDRQLIEVAGQVINRRGVVLPIPLPILQVVSSVIGKYPSLTEKIPNLTPDRIRDLLADRWVVDGSAFSRDFNWQPRDNFAETLRSTAKWYQSEKLLP